MASFVHIADTKHHSAIAKNGIRKGRRGVYCVPVTRDFAVTHQWSRELKRGGARALICVRFRIPDDEVVAVGIYNREKLSMTAAEAHATASDHTSAMGLEVILARSVLPKEITAIKPAPRLAGWRYYPAAKGKRPCGCRYCNRGEIRAQRLIDED